MQFRKYWSELNKQDILYIVGSMLLIACKALGFEENTSVFRMIMMLGSLLIGIKVILDKNSIIEWLVIVATVGFGIFQFFNMGSLGLVIIMILIVGMKNIEIDKLFEALAFEYVVCFILTTFLAYFEVIDPNYVTTIKYGHEVIRNSLGYSHPNVLHTTYVILMCLVLRACNLHGKQLYLLIGVLFSLNFVVWLFSYSQTGMLMSISLLVIYPYFEWFHYKKKQSIFFAEKVLINVFIALSMCGYICLAIWMGAAAQANDGIDQLYVKINEILNQRVLAIDVHYVHNGMRLLGGKLNTYGGWALDCSYAYALFSYGLLFYILLVYSYFATMNYLIKNGRYFDIVIMIVLMFGGITEPFLFNVSIKNLTVFYIGEWIFYSLSGKMIKE